MIQNSIRRFSVISFSVIVNSSLLLCCSKVYAQQSEKKTTPLPSTTTQERMVNSVGLEETPPLGWHPDFIGAWRGDFDLSLGVKIWTDTFNFRNLTLGGAVDIAPGIRARAQFRRREGEKHFFQGDTDEAYIEAFNQYRGSAFDGGISVRAGRVRYLHFPYPDAISQFDQVPGISDLTGGIATDYRDLVLQAEAATHGGWGAHIGGLAQIFGSNSHSNIIDAYAFYRSDFGRGWHVEGRIGDIALRFEPLGRPGQPGQDIYLGKQLGEFNLGVLYEKKDTEREFSGVMVQFRPGSVTRQLGHVGFDYSRRPTGITMQFPLWHGRMRESRFVHSGDYLVGEVRAVRIKTLWQQGFLRNQYEHRLASWGETGDSKLRCVVTEEPWYLQTEALVSPHLVPDARWEHDRMGPGQFVQRVTYRYYRSRPPGQTNSAI